MKQFELKPEIHYCGSCEEFCCELQIGPDDLILTNEFIYRPFLEKRISGAQVIFQEQFGSGEPSDEMAEKIYAQIKGDPKRVITIGGGTVLDLAKLFAPETVMPILDLYGKKSNR